MITTPMYGISFWPHLVKIDEMSNETDVDLVLGPALMYVYIRFHLNRGRRFYYGI